MASSQGENVILSNSGFCRSEWLQQSGRALSFKMSDDDTAGVSVPRFGQAFPADEWLPPSQHCRDKIKFHDFANY